MATQEVNRTKAAAIDEFAESISDLESQINTMKNEIYHLREMRLSQLKSKNQEIVHIKTPISSRSIPFKYSDCGDGNLIEKLQRKIEFLEENNNNITDELNEYKNAFNDKSSECESYREKYLNAQKQADEYYRKNNNLITEYENQQYYRNTNDETNCNENEIGRLTFVLETTAIEFNETQSKLKVAERTITALSNDLQACIIKCERFQKDLENVTIKNSRLNSEVQAWKSKYDELETRTLELMKNTEKIQFLEDCLDSKTNECYDLNAQIDRIREENAKHVSRIKERCSMQKRAFQSQISGLEMELVQLRENLNAAYKDREELKLRMQNEIISLEQKFSNSQLEIKNLKSHVNILKTSYASMLHDINAMEDDEDKQDKLEENQKKLQKNLNNNLNVVTNDTSFKLDYFCYSNNDVLCVSSDMIGAGYCRNNDDDGINDENNIEVGSNDIESALLTLRSISDYTIKSTNEQNINENLKNEKQSESYQQSEDDTYNLMPDKRTTIEE